MFSHPRVGVLGFDQAQQRELETLLTFASPTRPVYVLPAQPSAAQFWIVNLDDVQAHEHLAQVAGQWSRTVVVGSQAAMARHAQRFAAQLLRPVNAGRIVRALDQAVQAVQAEQGRVSTGLAAKRSRVCARLRRAAQTQVLDFQQSTAFSNAVLSDHEPRLKAVLLVDDDNQSRPELAQRLQRLGCAVETVVNVQAAWQSVQRQAFGFVLINAGRQGADAWALCRRLRQADWAQPHSGRAPQRPRLIMLVSRWHATDRIRGMLAGCDDCLVKPLTQRDLIRVLAKHDACFERVFENTLPPTTLLNMAPAGH